jgi:hypothetical protein
MVTLVVDFNMFEETGLVPALLDRDQAQWLRPGAKVIAADGEGTECQSEITEISGDGRYALLSPIGGTWRRDSTFRPSVEDLLTR